MQIRAVRSDKGVRIKGDRLSKEGIADLAAEAATSEGCGTFMIRVTVAAKQALRSRRRASLIGGAACLGGNPNAKAISLK